MPTREELQQMLKIQIFMLDVRNCTFPEQDYLKKEVTMNLSQDSLSGTEEARGRIMKHFVQHPELVVAMIRKLEAAGVQGASRRQSLPAGWVRPRKEVVDGIVARLALIQ